MDIEKCSFEIYQMKIHCYTVVSYCKNTLQTQLITLYMYPCMEEKILKNLINLIVCSYISICIIQNFSVVKFVNCYNVTRMYTKKI